MASCEYEVHFMPFAVESMSSVLDFHAGSLRSSQLHVKLCQHKIFPQKAQQKEQLATQSKCVFGI